MGLVQIVPHGAQDLWLTGYPDITFFKTTYTKQCNIKFFIRYDASVFARQILQIDWPQSKLPSLPDHIADAIFRLTDFETCLIHGRFLAAIDMFVPDEHTREWGSSHPCMPVREIYTLLEDQQQKDEIKQAFLRRRRQDQKLAKANRATVKHVRKKHALNRIHIKVACLQTKYYASQLPGDKLFN